jgi:PncC family amidohydrolase
MAQGALARLDADLTASVTGIAGPGGGTPEKPVGTVWFATAFRGHVASVRSIVPGARSEMRARTAQAALYLLLRRLRSA